MSKIKFGIIDSSRWMWHVGSLLGVLGATEGAIAALVFNWAQNTQLSPGLQFLMAGTGQDNGLSFTVILIAGFILSGTCALLSTRVKRFNEFVGITVLFLGIALLILSVFSGASIGMLTFYGAILVLLSGIWFILAIWLQPLSKK